jgi:hypothetical protein
MTELEARRDDGTPRCQARTKNGAGRQCRMPALEEDTFCEHHSPAPPSRTRIGGRYRTEREAAVWRMARALPEVPRPTTRAGRLAVGLRTEIDAYLLRRTDEAPPWPTVRAALAIVTALVEEAARTRTSDPPIRRRPAIRPGVVLGAVPPGEAPFSASQRVSSAVGRGTTDPTNRPSTP